jgi:hypothetical protein
MASSDSDIQASGGDYQTLAEWWAAKDSETGTHTANCADEAFAGVAMNNASTAGDAYIIQPQSGAKHDGRSRRVSGSGAAVVVTSGIAIYQTNMNDKPLTIRDMVIENTGGAGTSGITGTDASGTLKIHRCVIERGSAGGDHAIKTQGTAYTLVEVFDNIIAMDNTASRGIDTRQSGTVNNIQGNTVYGGAYGIMPQASGNVANNIAVNTATSDYFSSDPSGGHGPNIAEDTSADNEWGNTSINGVEVLETGGGPTKDYVAFVDKDFATGDYHLVDLEDGTWTNVAIAGGAASKGTGTDIDGDTRDGSTPDIGADEIAVAAATLNVPRTMIFQAVRHASEF